MCPIYAVLAAPLARPTGVKVLLWFTHWRAQQTALDRDPRVVEGPERRRADVSDPDRKLVAIGHGIDVSDLPCVKRPEDRDP